MKESKTTPRRLLWRPALAAAISLVALLAMGGGLFQGSSKVFADTPIIFTGGGPDIGGSGSGDATDENPPTGDDGRCDKHLKHAARELEHAARDAAKDGKHAAEHAAKHTRHADKHMEKYRECLAKFLVASVLAAPDPQAAAAAVGLDLEAIGIGDAGLDSQALDVAGGSADSVAWDAIKWNAIKWNAIQWDAIKWNAIKWNFLPEDGVSTAITFE